MMNTSKAGSALLACCCAIGLSCALLMPEPAPLGPQEVAAADDSGTHAAAASLEAERNDPAIIQARFSIGSSSGPPGTFVDIEVQGPRKQALAVCEQLVRSDMQMANPGGVDLIAKPVRPCSSDAMAEPEATTRLALVQVEHLDSVELLLRLANASKEDLQSIRVRRRYLSGYKDDESCQAALARQQAAQQQSDQQAQEAAKKWLEGEIRDQEKASAKACKAAPASKSCEQSKQLVKMLKDRQSRSATDPPAERSNRSVICRLR
ncbi:MAG: hypothetical protein HY898_32085 [Deltaproteobacteria bacterium]|nr:hypothetical protein [Deltaproteobacteria bacterium]